MPRKRLRPGWPVRNYTYECLIVGEPPQQLWDTAGAMQTLWNRLIDLHEAMRKGWTDDSPEKAVKAQAYKDLLGSQGHVYVACRDEGERLGLSAWQKWHVHDTFQAAMQAWRKHQREAPHKRHGLRDIIIPYRTQSLAVSLLTGCGTTALTNTRPSSLRMAAITIDGPIRPSEATASHYWYSCIARSLRMR
jgi:hypothetical protein